MTSAPASAPILVIGAGQAGLSVGHHLQRRDLTPGQDFLIVDRGPGPGGAWQHRWESLRLGDAHRIHDLPGMAEAGVTFANAPTDPPARDVVADYYERYERHYALDVKRPVDITSISRRGDGGFTAETADAQVTFSPRAVIAAVGTWGSPRMPAVPGASQFLGRQLVTSEFTAAADFADLRVGVVGGGASAMGFVRELADTASELTWFTRRPVEFHERDSALREDLGRESVRLQDEAARAGRPLPSIVSTTGMPLTPRLARLRARGLLERVPLFTRMVSDGVVLQDGTFRMLDAVIWAIGFEADLGPLAPIGVSAQRGLRVADGHAIDVPGLFLAGYGPQASTISANRGARRIARDTQAYLANGTWPPGPSPHAQHPSREA